MEKANKALLLKRGIGLRPSAYACRLFEIIAGQLYISENRGVGSNFLLFFFSCVVSAACQGADHLTADELPLGQDTTVFFGGTILTLDEDFSEFDSMAIKGNRILALGNDAGVSKIAGNEAMRIDLAGQTVMPGFIDAHAHPMTGVATSVFTDVGITRFRSVEMALSFMSRHPSVSEDWYLFIGLDLATQDFQESKLTRFHLDAVSSAVPVVVWHAGGHRMTVNSLMLERLNITSATEDPADSEYGRFEDGSPDGNLAGLTALVSALSQIDPYQKFDRFSGAIGLAHEWVRHGITTIGLASVGSPDDWRMIERLSASGLFPIRTRSYLLWHALEQWKLSGIAPGQGNARARIVGWKIAADGSNQAFTGLQRDPYLGKQSRGMAYMTQEALTAAISEGTLMGGQMAMHGNGDAGIDNIIAGVEAARIGGLDPIRPRIEHCSMIQDDQISKLKESDISCSFLIAHVSNWGSAFRDRVFGREKAQLLDRAGSFERAGVPFSLHSDYPVSRLKPLGMMQVAVTREVTADPNFTLAPRERASIEAALKAVTSVPAKQLLSDDELGSLEVGKLADFVILAEDPRIVPPNELGAIEVLGTWIDGRQQYPRAPAETETN